MGFLFFPTGLDIPSQRRALWVWVFLAMMIYRSVASLFLPGTHAVLLGYVPGGDLGWELAAALAQSCFAPPFPASMPMDAWALHLAGVAAAILFWAVVGPSLEETVGPAFLAALALVGAASGVVIVSLPHFGVGMAFWLGGGVTLLAAGFSCTLFLQNDVRVQWMGLWPGAIRFGLWKAPSLFLLVPVIGLILISQSLVYYPAGGTEALARHAAVPPMGWGLSVAGLGATGGWLWKQWDAARAERLGVPRRLKESW